MGSICESLVHMNDFSRRQTCYRCSMCWRRIGSSDKVLHNLSIFFFQSEYRHISLHRCLVKHVLPKWKLAFRKCTSRQIRNGYLVFLLLTSHRWHSWVCVSHLSLTLNINALLVKGCQWSLQNLSFCWRFSPQICWQDAQFGKRMCKRLCKVCHDYLYSLSHWVQDGYLIFGYRSFSSFCWLAFGTSHLAISRLVQELCKGSLLSLPFYLCILSFSVKHIEELFLEWCYINLLHYYFYY